MGSSGGQSQSTEPPKWQRPYIEEGLAGARNLYQNQQGSPSLSQATRNAWGQIEARAGNNPLTGAAQDLATQTLGGGFLGSNPYLDATFNKAAMATQGQLASQFAGAGRNVDQSEGNRAQQLNDLATNIYGGNYQAERDRQQQTLGMTPGLQASGYYDLGQLAGVGAAQDQYNQYLQNLPGQNLDAYLGRVGGGYGSRQTTSGGSGGGAGALGGALAGAQFGSAFGPWGTVIGGLGGGILGAF